MKEMGKNTLKVYQVYQGNYYQRLIYTRTIVKSDTHKVKGAMGKVLKKTSFARPALIYF